MARMGWVRMVVAALVVAGCSAPDLDVTVRDLTAAEIRPRLVLHEERVRVLSNEELDLLAAFLERSAGAGRTSVADDDAGRLLWIQLECRSCHALEAGRP